MKKCPLLPPVLTPNGYAVGQGVTIQLPASECRVRGPVPARRISGIATGFASNNYFQQFPRGTVLVQLNGIGYYPLSMVVV